MDKEKVCEFDFQQITDSPLSLSVIHDSNS